jgi:DNA-binding Xre family transcriptional regulator
MMIQFPQFKRQREVELDRDFSIKEIAEGSGVSADTISRLLRGKVKRMDEKTMNGLCAFFGVEPGQPVPFIIYEGE